MFDIALVLKAYYEALYEMMETNRQLLLKTVEDLLAEELIAVKYGPFDKEKFAAYLETSIAFVDERIELYNPFGIQYLYDRTISAESVDVDFNLNWYDSRDEFDDLVEAARDKLDDLENEHQLQQAARELIKEQGAFPDRSIILAYQAKPALNHLPDYVVATAIEQIL